MTGQLKWFIPDCYWAADSAPGAYPSHEAICVLNTGDQDAHLRLTFYFEDRPPIEANSLCQAKRTHHVRLDAFTDAKGLPLLPRGVPYAAMLESNLPVVAQYSRCDSSHPSVTLMTTMGYPCS